MELVAYLHSEMLCERLQQGESIDQNLDCQMLDAIAKSSHHAKSVLCVGLAAGAIAMNVMPIAAFAYSQGIADVQQLLARRGFNPGAIDGIKGSATTEAIIAAQTFYKLEADGVVGAQTLAALDNDTYEAESVAVAIPVSQVTSSNFDAVKNLQQLLSDRGFYGGAIDGISGPMTQEAIILAQKTYGLIADGVAGSLTIRALEADTNVDANNVAKVEVSYKEANNSQGSEVSSSSIKEGQVLLSNLGFYDGAIDGIQGSKTTAAIKEAQAFYGIPVDGVLGSQTLGALQS
ncbi:peptidoglycan-binding protein [Pseudanabaena sp. FACHB-1998]|uniref:peptidoglycan-binding domain-containing protein n=1 Tax=Pseudanabaena sp. FACHB-1998 TaxID=2692858 RepID=UPI001680F639|nr:peptidoglycan-binding protein [Pseudanabaena sp. FACHB-1998]MBD2178214.1 peptidoglycan-binding protein [Pseudanabaena sp. FACHB-1998]